MSLLLERLSEALASGTPRLIGLAGGVAAGKSTLAAQLADLLTERRVAIVATDGFLLPTAELAARGTLSRKGFPESYDVQRLRAFLSALRDGHPALAPRYSHVLYDPLPDSEGVLIESPDLVIVEGVNALQGEFLPFYDRALYLHADEVDLKRWYTERVKRVREEVRKTPDAYLHYLARLSESEFLARIERVWEDVNVKNLHEHILPTKELADLVVSKGPDHVLTKLYGHAGRRNPEGASCV